MEQAKFNEDWEVHQRVENLAKESLNNGLTPQEVRELILNSNEYMEWNSIVRCFRTEYHELFYYTDLLGEIEFKQYDNTVKQIARSEMDVLEKKEMVAYKCKVK